MSNKRMEAATKTDKSLFIPFITAGDPSEEATIDLALSLEEAGASILELGIPYSDPLADGPTIQAASKRALAGGMSLEKALHLVPVMRERGLSIPVIIFTYFNPLLQYGEKRFATQAEKLGIDGLLVPDLPHEESAHLAELCQQNDLSLISLVAPTSKQRMIKIAERAQGFLYCVSSLGVTGARNEIDPRVYDFLKTVREASSIPIAVGFGISSAEQVKVMKEHADGVVVGSALVSEIAKREQALKNAETRPQALAEIKKFVSSLISS
ncbi:tryptophan synthase subunit alpha [Halalkalibacter akibai]|uniref:Tryptophan synthase alpha chain n=1 Tax=Halalkalibacter akibai (strain ATCC 43226 / DSM 21942 / CIP 109018 / JCM 9157 / 1139) TaxID=1236973 RepID=W4QSG3_HALA3|nr:tryptophan synthase subunit alpha [Halalkalibacter akibai]GAE34563.1 tryptophan synthase alpha chain [Halalkalibacter akibai JCM 9157]